MDIILLRLQPLKHGLRGRRDLPGGFGSILQERVSVGAEMSFFVDGLGKGHIAFSRRYRCHMPSLYSDILVRTTKSCVILAYDTAWNLSFYLLQPLYLLHVQAALQQGGGKGKCDLNPDRHNLDWVTCEGPSLRHPRSQQHVQHHGQALRFPARCCRERP